jgi:glucose/arabinose dehydrogenase
MVLFEMRILTLFSLSFFAALLFLSSMTLFGYNYYSFLSYAQIEEEIPQYEYTTEPVLPDIYDTNLHAEVVAEGLTLPTKMAFLGPNDILVLEKEKGTVQRIVNGEMLPEPLLDVNVASAVERCMCGIAVSQSTPEHTYVFLYYTEAETADREDLTQGIAPLGNRLYRYELVNNKLVNPKLLLDLPADPGPRHNGGTLLIGPDNNLYITVGDVDGSHRGQQWQTTAQNYPDGVEADGRSGILRITLDGQPVPNGDIIGQENPLDLYYAYGIRNSFGIDFDPVTGNLWETENGPGNSDEINLVLPGFNSGWREVMGLISVETTADPADLVGFGGTGEYSDPELVWTNTAGPTAIKFLHSDRLGAQYQNDMFVGDFHNGRLYHFDLNEDRTQLILPESLADKIIATPESPGLEDIIFGQGFGEITDLEVGPDDGYLYVLSIGQGKIFKIVPGAPETPPTPFVTGEPTPEDAAAPEEEEDAAAPEEEEDTETEGEGDTETEDNDLF